MAESRSGKCGDQVGDQDGDIVLVHVTNSAGEQVDLESARESWNRQYLDHLIKCDIRERQKDDEDFARESRRLEIEDSRTEALLQAANNALDEAIRQLGD